MPDAGEVLGTFLGDDSFPVSWREGEAELFWVHDDLHCPNPISPMFFDIGGWWLTCDHMFRRFGTPFAADWVAKDVNGYVYTAAIPADPAVTPRRPSTATATARACPQDPATRPSIGAYLLRRCRTTRELPRLVARPAAPRDRAQLRLPGRVRHTRRSLVELAVLLEDAIDIHDRHWKIHWMLNFAQFSSTLALNATIARPRARSTRRSWAGCRVDVADRNWDSIEALWKIKEQVKGDAELRARLRGRDGGDVLRALEGSDAGRAFLRAASAVPASSAGSRSGPTSSLPDLAGARRRSWRPSAATSRRTTTTRRPSGRAARPREAKAELIDGVPRARRASGCRPRSTSRCA